MLHITLLLQKTNVKTDYIVFRLDDIIENEDVDEEEETCETGATKLQRRVSFVDEDDSKTLDITFKHSTTECNKEPYNPNKGIQKPSDIYDLHFKLFENETTSILKKSKYEAVAETSYTKPSESTVQIDTQTSKEPEPIVIKDVVEKVTPADPNLLTQARPTSLFKKKRLQNKS